MHGRAINKRYIREAGSTIRRGSQAGIRRSGLRLLIVGCVLAGVRAGGKPGHGPRGRVLVVLV